MSIIERDKSGRIVKKELTSEKAREMGKARAEKERDKTRRVDAILERYGLTRETADEVAILLAELAAAKGGGSNAAIRNLERLYPTMQASGSANLVPGEMEICQTCPHFRVHLTTDFWRVILDETGGQVID